MNRIAELRSKNGKTTLVGYDFSSSPEELVQRGDVECFIVSTEDGFSPLGASRRFFSNELGIVEEVIRELADWNRFENPKIPLVGLPRQSPTGNLKGVVLAASEPSKCYKQFAPARYNKPYKDFYYNVAYESIAYSAKVLGAEKIAMTHLSASGHFHEGIATCNAEALDYFCEKNDKHNISSFFYVGCFIIPCDLFGIQQLNFEGKVTRHRDIRTQTKQRNGYEVISLDWR